MEYRQLPHGNENEKFGILGLGFGGIGKTPPEEIEAIVRKAIDHGINFFDMCTAGATYAPVGRAIAGRRDKVFLQVHFGAVYDENGEYGWCRDFETIKKTFLWELETLGTDYVDFGFLHCVDEDADFEKLIEIGLVDYLKELKAKGIVHHIGFSSHTPSVANRIIDTGIVDMMMFSINPAYDFEKGDEYGIGSVKERFDLFQRCQSEGIGISVMKPFFAGQLLRADQSPFGVALNHYQCLQYAIDRPGVLVAVPGVQTMAHLDTLLGFLTASDEEKDYSVIGSFTADTITGTCVYCNHCQPCPAGIDIGLVNKYYDLALAGDAIAANHYTKLSVKADACLQCGHCESRCPFGVKQMERMTKIDTYFSKEEKMRTYFENVKKNFGFGCMRLPMNGDQVDYEETKKMVDTFLSNGFNYFDTAHGYLGGKSEIALRECLTSRYPRTSYILTNKLSTHHFTKNEEIRPLFESQLQICGVDYFDFYLMHAQDASIFAKYKECRAYETALEFLAEGKIKHLGISFHDQADVLDQILTEYPQIEVVQIQLNYVDFDDPSVQSRKCLEVCRKHGKPAIIMEPVKGGSLVNLPAEAQKVFDELHGGSNASYAIRFAASQEGMMMVLSGMGNMDMMRDNISYMKDFHPLNAKEAAAVEKVCSIFRSLGAIPCTACRYCTEVCPQGISIPDLFACLNAKKIFNNWNTGYYYNQIHTKNGGKASDCVKCGQCENICPQHLNIRELLEDVAKEFEKE